MTKRAHPRSEWLFRSLLRLYPREFQRRYGAEMLQTFKSELGETGGRHGATARLWVRTIAGLALEAPRERLRGADTDLVHAARQVRRRPVVALVTVVTLGLSTGIVAAVYAVADGVLFRPLPYRAPEELGVLITFPNGAGGEALPMTSAPDYLDFKRHSDAMEDFAAAVGFTLPLAGGGDPVHVRSAMVTANFFPLLGVDPIIGRHFRPEEQGPTAPPVAMITHDLWQGRFAGSPDVLGRKIELNGSTVEIVGVLPADFALYVPDGAAESISTGSQLKVWEVFQFDLTNFRQRSGRFLVTVGRRRAGATWAEVDREVQTLGEEIRSEVAEYARAGTAFEIAPLTDEVFGAAAPMVWLLLGAAATVFLIAAANVAGLTVARLSQRANEFRIRTSIGATGRRLRRLVLLESALLSVLAGGVGLGVAHGSVRLVQSLERSALPRLDSVVVGPGTLAVTLGAAVVATMLIGLLPGLYAVREGGARARGEIGTRRGRRFSNALIASEVAVSLALLIGTGLLLRTVVGLTRLDPGFRTEGVMTFMPAMPYFEYGGQYDAMLRFHSTLRDELAALPHVEAAGTTGQLPLAGAATRSPIGYDAATLADWGTATADVRVVSPGYFRAIGTPLLAGRTFTASDDRDHPFAAIVDETLARRAWPEGTAVGRRVTVRLSPNGRLQAAGRVAVEVVGVVARVKTTDLTGPWSPGQVYLPFLQQPSVTAVHVVRTSGPPDAVVAYARDYVRAFDPDMPLAKIRPLADYVRETTARERLVLVLIGSFAIVAFVMALVGVHATVAFVASRDLREYGLRLALGATPRSLALRVAAFGTAPSTVGILLGLALATVTGRAIESVLYGVTATDGVTYVSAALAMAAVSHVAALIPAARVSRLSPLRVLQSE